MAFYALDDMPDYRADDAAASFSSEDDVVARDVPTISCHNHFHASLRCAYERHVSAFTEKMG